MLRSIAPAFLALALGIPASHGLAGRERLVAASDAKEELRIDRERSHLVAITDTAGFLRFLGHRHAILATDWSARVVWDARRPEDASIVVNLRVHGLRIDTERALELAGLDEGPDAETVKKLQATMLGPRVLDADRYPTIVFRSQTIEVAGKDALVVRGELTLHGHSAPLEVPVRRERLDRGAMRFTGRVTIRQSDYGIEPESIAGVVKVADAMTIRFDIATLQRRGTGAPFGLVSSLR